jgi:hypothetical protein
MNQGIAQRWVQALRSGEYQQGKRCLRSNDGFCCLGVLCELHRQEAGGEWVPSRPVPDAPQGLQYYDAADGDWDNSLLPDTVQEWAGLRSVSPGAKGYELPECNDSGWTFIKLADLIETNWKDL